MYHLFAGWRYYPSGGLRDLIGSYETMEEAREVIKANNWDWWHIADSDMDEIDWGSST
jgi:hypothetical protein